MKKLFLLLAVAFAFTACKNVTPEIKFELNLTGFVKDSITHINGDFNVNVTNFVVDKELVKELKSMTTTDLNEFETSCAWLDSYIQANVIDEFAPSTQYEVIVKGLLHEEKSGISLIVNKTFTNIVQ